MTLNHSTDTSVVTTPLYQNEQSATIITASAVMNSHTSETNITMITTSVNQVSKVIMNTCPKQKARSFEKPSVPKRRCTMKGCGELWGQDLPHSPQNCIPHFIFASTSRVNQRISPQL